MDFNIRRATKEDLPEVVALVKELALYEKAPDDLISLYNIFFVPKPETTRNIIPVLLL